MAYKIRYGSEVPETVPVRPFRGAWFVVILVCGVAGWLLRSYWNLPEISLEPFRQAVAEGEPFGEALESFCRDVLADAQILS